MLKLLQRIIFKHSPRSRGQSFLELALVLPILLLMLMGLVEVAFFMSKYLDGLDLTREAARFASIRDPFSTTAHDYDCLNADRFDFFWDTSCIFSPPDKIAACDLILPRVTDVDLGLLGMLNWCNGLNKYLDFDPSTDDVVITAFMVGPNNDILKSFPYQGSELVTDEKGHISYFWALSNHIGQGATANPLVNNFQRDCKGGAPNAAHLPYYTQARIEDMGLTSITAGDFPADIAPTAPPGTKGFIGVELYYCHAQVLGLPVITIFVPNPLMLHVYTLMPLPAAAPTPTPKP